MSTIKLPPPSFYHKHEDICGNEVGPPTPFWNQTAVEEAVCQALAAQASDPRREAFEGWAAASKRRGNFKLRDGEGYADGYANSDWHVWKACVAALATQKQGDSDA